MRRWWDATDQHRWRRLDAHAHTDGDYRLATLDASTEMPCYIGWEYERAQHNLAGSAVDEWLTENERTDIAYVVAHNGGTIQLLTTDNDEGFGGTDCINSLLSPFTGTYANSPRAFWFGGQWLLAKNSGANFYQGDGLAEFPIDPRSFQDPNIATWR